MPDINTDPGGAVRDSKERARQGGYDPARRRRSVREGRERGCWVYIPAVELVKTGIDVDKMPPLYRTFGTPLGTVLVRFYDGEVPA